jgi:hypothetical protein
MYTHDLTDSNRTQTWQGLWRRGLRAGIAAASINIVLYLIGIVFGVFSSIQVLSSASPEPRLAPILVASITAALAATALYRVLAAHVKMHMPILLAIATIVLMVSFVAPTAQADWSRAQIALLELMHIAVATAVVTALWDWDRTMSPYQHTHVSPRARLS